MPRNTRENNDGGTEISGPQVVVFAFTGMGSPDHVVLLRRPAPLSPGTYPAR